MISHKISNTLDDFKFKFGIFLIQLPSQFDFFTACFTKKKRVKIQYRSQSLQAIPANSHNVRIHLSFTYWHIRVKQLYRLEQLASIKSLIHE